MSKQDTDKGRDIFGLLSLALRPDPAEIPTSRAKGFVPATLLNPVHAPPSVETDVNIHPIFSELAAATQTATQAMPVKGQDAHKLRLYTDKDPLFAKAVAQYKLDYRSVNAASQRAMRTTVSSHLQVMGAGQWGAATMVNNLNRLIQRDDAKTKKEASGSPDGEEEHTGSALKSFCRGKRALQFAIREFKQDYGNAWEDRREIMKKNMRRRLHTLCPDEPTKVERLLGLIVDQAEAFAAKDKQKPRGRNNC